ncbi:MAG TPA: sulfotransferase [Allosphingosinicella sp.]
MDLVRGDGEHYPDIGALAERARRPGGRWTAISSEQFTAPFGVAGAELARVQADVCGQLAEAFSEAHILLLTRGFRSVLVSGYSQYVREGGEEDFYVFREVGQEDMAYAVHAWDYDYLVRIYREAFGGRVIALPYELLRDDPSAFLRALEARLGIDRLDIPLDRLNPSLKPHEMRWYPRLARALARIGGRRLQRWHAARIGSPPWRLAAGALQAVFPAVPVSEALIADAHIDFFRGRASAFADDPLYAHYRADYLLDPPSL